MATTAFANLYKGRRVLLTGHTGFKGSWLAEWLLALGAEVTGIALPPNTSPSLFNQLSLEKRLHRHIIGDIRDLPLVTQTFIETKPDFIFHLAAQPLVRYSYQNPVETFSTNIIGTANILEAARLNPRPCSIVAVTTDKCYENKEQDYAYREDDPMGGHDPYSASKGAAELLINAYRRSFFSAPGNPVRLASARAGNVIGGGDYSADRIVPDSITALQNNLPIPVRNKHSTRPWQHVLEPLSGYLTLAAALSGQLPQEFPLPALAYATPFNFGPTLDSNRNVAALVEEILKNWPGTWKDNSDPTAPHEARLLNLDINKASQLLHWRPVWNFEETIARTVTWYRLVQTNGTSPHPLTLSQINDYTTRAAAGKTAWAI